MKIKIISSFPAFPCAFYRSIGVLPYVNGVETEIMKEVHWQSIQKADILFIERPDNKGHVQAIDFAKDLGIPVWIDYDDNLLDLQPDNPGFRFYSDQRTRQCIEYALKVADVVTVSTPEIARHYEKYSDKISVIPNAFNDYYFKLEDRKNETKTIAWRGSDTHRYDIMEYSKEIWDLAESTDEWKWNFFGEKLWYIHQAIGPLRGIKHSFEVGNKELVSYMHDLRRSMPEILFVPLLFNDFNSCKSNIAWIEGTYAGAACLCPDMEEWRLAGTVLYKDKESFANGFEKLIHSRDYRQEKYSESFQTIKDSLMLSKVNSKRFAIVEMLRK